MSTPVRTEDREHFSLVRDSLARDGLHVAMVAHDRRRLQDYAAALARTLASQAGLRVEAYQPGRLEGMVVDLMLHRFDAALSGIAGPDLSVARTTARTASTSRPGCVLFIPDAHALPHAEFRQLLRIAAGSRRNGLRLVALFDAGSAVCDERIAELGTQVARWDLDDETNVDSRPASRPASRRWHRERVADAAATACADATGMPGSSQRRAALAAYSAHRRLSAHGRRWLAAAGLAAALALLPPLLSLHHEGSMLTPVAERGLTHSVTRSVTRSGHVELAGDPRQAWVRTRTADEERQPVADRIADTGVDLSGHDHAGPAVHPHGPGGATAMQGVQGVQGATLPEAASR